MRIRYNPDVAYVLVMGANSIFWLYMAKWALLNHHDKLGAAFRLFSGLVFAAAAIYRYFRVFRSSPAACTKQQN